MHMHIPSKSLEKDVLIAEKNLSWSSTTQWNHLSYQHEATLGITVPGLASYPGSSTVKEPGYEATQAKSEHSLVCIVLT